MNYAMREVLVHHVTNHTCFAHYWQQYDIGEFHSYRFNKEAAFVAVAASSSVDRNKRTNMKLSRFISKSCFGTFLLQKNLKLLCI